MLLRVYMGISTSIEILVRQLMLDFEQVKNRSSRAVIRAVCDVDKTGCCVCYRLNDVVICKEWPGRRYYATSQCLALETHGMRISRLLRSIEYCRYFWTKCRLISPTIRLTVSVWSFDISIPKHCMSCKKHKFSGKKEPEITLTIWRRLPFIVYYHLLR